MTSLVTPFPNATTSTSLPANFRTVAEDVFQGPLPPFRSLSLNLHGTSSLPPSILGDATSAQSVAEEPKHEVRGVPFPWGFSTDRGLPKGARPNPSRRTRKVSGGRSRNPSQGVNQTMEHLKVLWTALSLALGVEVRGELIRGLPCITRFNQLFCRSGGTSYPSEKIEKFIDDNKALIRRMHGEFISISVLADSIRSGRRRRSVYEKPGEEPFDQHMGEEAPRSYLSDLETEGTFLLRNDSQEAGEDNPYVNVIRRKRQSGRGPGPLPKSERDRVDACLSEEEVATPYWASNSRGKILAIVNTNEFSQIIHQEICTKTTTKRCNNDCGCEQKYKYHRLMAYDPDNDCKGIFMDWFLFPSCCSCRCDPL